MWKLLAPVVLLVTLLAGVALTDRPRPAAEFRFLNRGDVSTLDVSLLSWMQDLRVGRMVYEGLVVKDIFSWGYEARPGVAESWERSADGLTYTFRLRADARWSNGDPVLASDFAYSWMRSCLPETGADYVKFLSKIRGVDGFIEWRASALAGMAEAPGAGRAAAARELWARTLERFAAIPGLRFPDERTVVIELERPTPYFLDLVAFPTFFPVHARTVRLYERLDEVSGRMRWDQGWTKPPRLVSNGPMMVAVWRFKRDMRLEKNPHYWNREAIRVGSISIPTIEDGNAGVLAFETGAIDWASDVTAPYRGDIVRRKREFHAEHAAAVAEMRAQGLDPIEIDRRLPPDPRKNIHVFPAFGTYFYNFNCLARLPDGRANPFADARVRRAFAMAIDRRAITETIRQVGEPEATTLIPPGSIAGYEGPRGLGFDPAGARRALAEAGYATGRDFPVAVEILFNKDAGHDLIAQSVAKDWERHLGVTVVLQQKEIKAFREDLKNGNFMVSRAGWFGDYGDPTTFLMLSYARVDATGAVVFDGNNDRKFYSPRFTALMDAAEAETGAGRRLAMLAEGERMLMEEELPMTPIFHYCQVYLFDPHRVSGISSHPRQEQLLHWVEVYPSGDAPAGERTLPARAGRYGRAAK